MHVNDHNAHSYDCNSNKNNLTTSKISAKLYRIGLLGNLLNSDFLAAKKQASYAPFFALYTTHLTGLLEILLEVRGSLLKYGGDRD